MTIKESNILKGFGIILMYFHHLFYLPENFANYNIIFTPFSESFVITFSQMCKVCVAIFVFATAYGVTKSINSRYKNAEGGGLSEYSLARYVKLMSGFWFIWTLAQATSFIGDRYKIYGDDAMLRIKYMIIDFWGCANLLGTPSLNATWWYMSFAILLVFIMPWLCLLVKKIGIGALVIAIFLPIYMGQNVSSSFWFYLFTIVLGILLAENNSFEKLKDKMDVQASRKIIYIVCVLLLLALLLYMRCNAVATIIVAIYDGIFTVLLCVLSVLLADVPVISRIMEFMGIHSMNMFLIHTFIKAYYFQDFTYQWKYPWLILLVLLADTLVISVIIEWTKKKIGYKRLTDCLIKKSNLFIARIRG